MPPFSTACIMMFSLAMKGSSDIKRLRMTLGYTTRPSVTLSMMFRMASVARKPSAMAIRLLALSSRVRSNHWVPAVKLGLSTSTIRYRARAQMRSQRMGLRL